MNERIVFHIDVNNAFLSWTAVKLLKAIKKISEKYHQSLLVKKKNEEELS